MSAACVGSPTRIFRRREFSAKRRFAPTRGTFSGTPAVANPQRRELNRGWSAEGREFRAMERYVAQHSGTFFYHRPIYNDETWVPQSLEYGVLEDDTRWRVKTFANK